MNPVKQNPAAIRPEALSQLLSIPLTKADEDLLQKLCTNAPSWLKPPALYVLQDLACTRLVQVGRHVDAIKLDRRFCSVPLKEGWSKGGDEGRRKMVQELIDALPSVERAMLDVDVVRVPTLLPCASSTAWTGTSAGATTSRSSRKAGPPRAGASECIQDVVRLYECSS